MCVVELLMCVVELLRHVVKLLSCFVELLIFITHNFHGCEDEDKVEDEGKGTNYTMQQDEKWNRFYKSS